MEGGEEHRRALETVRRELAAAVAARKCHRCGCLHAAVGALAVNPAGRAELAQALAEARAVSVPKEYDCLGCSVCYPANAANAFAAAFPGEAAGLDLCPAEAPGERRGWPPLPGDYHVLHYRAPVAICTLNSSALAARLDRQRPDGVAIIGTLHTENLGIERIVRNILANPYIRFLVLCGEDTRQAIGHLPGQSLASLHAAGIDESGRIVGARGRRPVLRNVSRGQVAAFRDQVELVTLIGEERDAAIAERVHDCAARDPGPFAGACEDVPVEVVAAGEPQHMVPDPAGYFVVYPDAPRHLIVVEHYTNAGVLGCVLEGVTPSALWAAAIERGLLTRLDHAAYLGRELARAERAITTGEPYVQDRAPGEVAQGEPAPVEADSPILAAPGDATSARKATGHGWIAAIAVAAAAAGIIAFKELRGRPGSTPRAKPAAAIPATPLPGAGTVLLFADPDEAEEACGCGEIIRLVREAAGRGVPVREVAPGRDAALERAYRVTVAPTVLFLDASGRGVARFEGEERQTIDAIRSELESLAKTVR